MQVDSLPRTHILKHSSFRYLPGEQRRKLLLTRRSICLGLEGEEVMLDYIPLHEVVSVTRGDSDLGLVYDLLDEDGDGLVSSKELQVGLALLGFSAEDVHDIFYSDLSRYSGDRHVLECRYVDVDCRSGEQLDPPPLTRKQFNKNAEALREKAALVIVVKTADEGYNSGMSFYLAKDSKDPQRGDVDDWIGECTFDYCCSLPRALADLLDTCSCAESIREAASAAKRSFRMRAALLRLQSRLLQVYRHGLFQGLVALTILANFALYATQLELHPVPGSELHDLVETLDFAFTMAFAGELAINLIAHWFVPFFRDGW